LKAEKFKMSKIHFQISYPTIIESIIVYFLLRYRKKRYGCAFRKIYLTKGKYAMVSPEDFEEVNKHKWRVVNNHNETYYAVRMTYPCGRKKLVMMHREIMKLPPFDSFGGSAVLTTGKAQDRLAGGRPFDSAHGRGRLVIDHGDGDGLNNTRENLSIVTAAENSYNRRKCKNECSSRYKGVSREKKSNRWRAIINYKGIPIRLGYFDNEIEAAKAYDEAAKELYREYAKLNFG
ncbi:MAG: AP2/ERF family transcription factor, partial [Sedimentisphaerales bacterium]